MIRFTAIARTAVLLTVASGVLVAAQPVFAADDDTVPQAAVNVAGTDFSSAQAVAHIRNRVRHTAFEICTRDWDGKGVLSMDQRKCYDTAMHNGLAQIESKRMEALRQTSTDLATAQPGEHPAH